MKKKYYYYIGVQCADGMRLVTRLESGHRFVCGLEDKPLALPQSVANDIAEAICMSGTYGVLVKTFFELDQQFYTAAMRRVDDEEGG